MQHISLSWLCERNTRRRPSNRLKTKFLTLLALLAFALAPRVAWGNYGYFANYSAYSSGTYSDLTTTTSLSVAVNGTYDGRIFVLSNSNITAPNPPYTHIRFDANNYNRKNFTINTWSSANNGKFKLTRSEAVYIEITEGYSLTVKNVIIDGNNVSHIYPMFYCNGGTLIMKGEKDNGSDDGDANNCKVINCINSNGEGARNGSAVLVNGSTSDFQCRYVTFEDNQNRDIHGIPWENKVYGGGAICIRFSIFTLENCYFYNNLAYEAGGAILLYGAYDGTISNCTFGANNKGNTAYLAGGAIYGSLYDYKTINITGATTFAYNSVTYNGSVGLVKPTIYGMGGAAFFLPGTGNNFNIGDGTNTINFTSNTTRGSGGALVLWCESGSSTFRLRKFNMANNEAGDNGYYASGYSNAVNGGGGLFIFGGTAAIHNDSHLIIENGTFSNNRSYEYGGATLIVAHNTNLKNCSFDGNYNTNTGSGMGGAVCVIGKQIGSTGHVNKFDRCTFTKNGIQSGTVKAQYGGAISVHNKTDVQLLGCTVGGSEANANKATEYGGGIYVSANSSLRLDYNTASGSQAVDIAYNEAGIDGGGIYLAGSASGGATANCYGNATYPIRIQNNKSGGYGSGVLLGKEALLGVSGKVLVENNYSTRTTHTVHTEGSTGAWQDDVCLNELSDAQGSKGKIKILAAITGSNIGVGERQPFEGDPRDLDLEGDKDRQFTINYDTYYDDHGGKGFFYSNDKVLKPKLLPGASPSTTNILELTLGHALRQAWYVAGIVDDSNVTWGSDSNSGLYPDVPKRTLTGPNGVFASGYNPTVDHIFVVRSISTTEEAKVRKTSGNAVIRFPYKLNPGDPDTITSTWFTNGSHQIPDNNDGDSQEVVLHRYPGGHVLSSGLNDISPNSGPRANTGPVLTMDDATYPAKLYNIHMDGMDDYSGKYDATHNPQTLTISPLSALLSVNPSTAAITLDAHCHLLLNNNGTQSTVSSGREQRIGGGVYCAGTLIGKGLLVDKNVGYSGGGIYIAPGGTVTLEGDNESPTIIGGDDDNTNHYNRATFQGGGICKKGTLKVKGNVYIVNNQLGSPVNMVSDNVAISYAYGSNSYIEIVGALDCESSIGVSKRKFGLTYASGTKELFNYDKDMNEDRVGSTVRTVIAQVVSGSNQTWARDAYMKGVFFDDDDKFGVWSFNYGSGATGYSDQKDYFIETWRTYADASGFTGSGPYNVSTAAGLAYLAKQVNNGTDYNASGIAQTADIDLGAHYWEPIGKIEYNCSYFEHKPFAGSYDGQGHLITNMISILPVQGMGLFGVTGIGSGGSLGSSTGRIQRVFVINADLTMTCSGKGSMGGIVGVFSNALIDRCEATGTLNMASELTSNDNAANYDIGGLVGGPTNILVGMRDEELPVELRNSFSVVTINANGVMGTYGGLIGTVDFERTVNCYTKNTINSPGGDSKTGALAGKIDNANLMNCYVVSTNVNKLAGAQIGGFMACNYAPYHNDDNDKKMYYTNALGEVGDEIGATDDADLNAYYKPTIGADQLGYMYADNIIVYNNGEAANYHQDVADLTITGPLFEALNAFVEHPKLGSTVYDRWARPALAYYVTTAKGVGIEKPINGDLPVLMMGGDISGFLDKSTAEIGLEGFRALSTITLSGESTTHKDGYALQYSGPIRDDDDTGNDPAYTDCPEIDGMIARSTATDSHFIYGDVVNAPTQTITDKAKRVSIYEHAAIKSPGTLKDFDETYVGITFDNSGTKGAMSTEGMNGLPEQSLPRDWHLISTPLRTAPLGFNYKKSDGTDTNENNGPSNNPWESNAEFSWLGGGNNRYWMTGWTGSQSNTGGGYSSIALSGSHAWTDGYFPSTFDASLTGAFASTCITGANEAGKYPYGMDFYSWFEPQYHYINFKRNGPNHWHSDEPHDHLAYRPEPASNNLGGNTYGANKNETTLLTGKGYMASIATPTLLQSHGHLNEGNQTIAVTKSTYPSNVKIPAGWNLIGNPYHAYLDFNAFSTTNTVADNQYVVYNADGYKLTDEESGGYSGHYGDGFSYYVKNGSSNGAYASRYLHPHQGFFVKTSSSKDLSFSPSMTTTRSGAGGGGSYRDDERPAYPLVNLFLTSAKGCADVCVVEFNRPEWGGGTKLREMYTGNGLFYAFHDNKNYAALFATPDAERIPLKFEPKDAAGDTYTIHWNTQNGDFHRLILVDNIAGVQYDMLRNESYSFQGRQGDYYSRFYITFGVTGVDEEEDDDETSTTGGSFAFFDGTQWVVTGGGTLEMIDLQGRVLYSTNVVTEGQARVSLPKVSNGMYLLRMSNANGTRVQKIVVR